MKCLQISDKEYIQETKSQRRKLKKMRWLAAREVIIRLFNDDVSIYQQCAWGDDYEC